MNEEEKPLPTGWAARSPQRKYADAGPTLEAIDRLMDGLLIPPPMKQLIQIFMARGILQPDQAEKAANGFRRGLRAAEWKEAIEAQEKRLR
jgi:hypothetical protein